MNEHEITEGVLDFILGGKAAFTIYQEASGAKPAVQAKYEVRMNENKNCWFVSAELKNGVPLTADAYVSSGNLVYQGYFTRDMQFRVGKKGVQDYNEAAINALMWVLRHSESLPRVVHIYHHGKCSRCGRKLTDAMSLRCGIGPTCRNKVDSGRVKHAI